MYMLGVGCIVYVDANKGDEQWKCEMYTTKLKRNKNMICTYKFEVNTGICKFHIEFLFHISLI